MEISPVLGWLGADGLRPIVGDAFGKGGAKTVWQMVELL